MRRPDLDSWFEPQMLRQEGDMDCGVSVLEALASLTRSEILRDMPDAVNGITTDQLEAYLRSKGFEVSRYQVEDEYSRPCAHLVQSGGGCHWIYEAADGGIHDPSPAFQHMPPKLVKLSHYVARILTVAIRPRK